MKKARIAVLLHLLSDAQ